MAKTPLKLGPTRGIHSPTYELTFYRDGDPSRPIRDVDWRSVTAIQTSKSIQDLAGTFSVTLKDRRARRRVREMDVGRIRMRGHYSPGLHTVLKVIVDDVRKAGSSDPYASQDDTVIEGRCIGKYLQVTSLFLPVWDPEALLPTALTFGYGDATKKVGGNTPYEINRYLIRRFTYGIGAQAGMSGVPASRYWLDLKTRFGRTIGQTIPFMQFDEDSVATAFKRMEITGYTEAWVDELGRQVFRRPRWDAPVDYHVTTNELLDWDFPRTDVGVTTYVEVIPAGDPGIDTATAQALRAGRAPVPSSYLAGNQTIGQNVSASFVIDTDKHGKPTAKGRANEWYRLQRRLGVRPQQISSPLIFTQAQAQAQAEGLLRFYSRMVKGFSITIPGAPEVRLGTNMRLSGDLEGDGIDRIGYIEQVSHDYVEGDGYRTRITATHGRDKGDPRWGELVLPKFNPADLATGDGGLLAPGSGGGGAIRLPASFADVDLSSPETIIDGTVLPIGRSAGLLTPQGTPLTPANNTTANHLHSHLGAASDHAGPPSYKWATDMSNGSSPTPQMDAVSRKLAELFGIPWPDAIFTYSSGRGIGIRQSTHHGYRFQLIYRYSDPQAGNHFNHVHFGAKKVSS